MLTPASQLMPSLLQVLNPQNMTESNFIWDFNDAPCKNRCGELIPCHWQESHDKKGGSWIYAKTCWRCERKRSEDLRYKQVLNLSGLTNEETVLTLQNFNVGTHNQDAHNAARRLAMGDAVNLFLHGKAGRGKSHLAIGVVVERMATSKVRFIPVTKALMLIRSNLKETSEDDYIDRLLTCDVLALDDFGANKLTEWNLSFLDCLIDEWYRRRKTGLIVTSNFSLRQISENISDRIASRLAQLCEVYELSGDDHRIS